MTLNIRHKYFFFERSKISGLQVRLHRQRSFNCKHNLLRPSILELSINEQRDDFDCLLKITNPAKFMQLHCFSESDSGDSFFVSISESLSCSRSRFSSSSLISSGLKAKRESESNNIIRLLILGNGRDAANVYQIFFYIFLCRVFKKTRNLIKMSKTLI